MDPTKTADGKPFVSLWPTEGTKSTAVTPNWCDRTTWYSQAVRVVDELVIDSGDHLTYNLSHPNIIDTYHGKISGEDFLKSVNGNNYRVAVKVNGTTKTERDPHLAAGGDYEVNYNLGTVTFFAILDPADEVIVTYHYENGSEWVLRPLPGKILKIRKVEVQFSEDVVLNDSVRFQPYGKVEVYAPQYTPNPYPAGTLIPLGNATVYKTMVDYINEANGAYPVIPAVGGSSWRTSRRAIHTFSWDYLALTELNASSGIEVRIRLEHDLPMSGTIATATFYSLSVDA